MFLDGKKLHPYIPTTKSRGFTDAADTCKRQELGCKHGERYELCVSVHAEMNALLQCDANNAEGATLYLYGSENGKAINAEPCMMCAHYQKYED